MITKVLLVAGVCSILGAAQAEAQDVGPGETLYQSVCRNCHGPTARGMASYPKLAGQSAEYLTSRLEQYRDGERVGPNSMLMIPHATPLSDDDISNLVSYITVSFN